MLNYPFKYPPATMSFSLEASILKYFGNLEDPRMERTKHHPLISIVAIAILAVI